MSSTQASNETATGAPAAAAVPKASYEGGGSGPLQEITVRLPGRV